MNFTTVKDITLPGNLTVKKMQHGNVVLWEASGGGEDYSTEPMFFENTTSTDGTVSFVKASSNAPTIEVFTSTDNSTWTSAGTTDTTAITATLPANGRLYVRATADRWGSSTSYYNKISVDTNCTLNGNILSLLYADGFSNYTELPNYTYTFYYLLRDNATILSAEHLIMPSNTRNYCYGYMFYGCSSLQTAPELPATSLSSYCYQYMFRGCTSLTTAPVLPATSLTSYCYRYMFYGCSSLNYVKALFTNWSSSYTNSWLGSVAATGTLVLNGGYTGTLSSDASGLPSGWEVEYTYLTAPTITQTDNEITITTVHPHSGVKYTVQPDGGSESAPVEGNTVIISENCTIRAFEFDASGNTSTVSSYYAEYKTFEDITVSYSRSEATIRNYNGGSVTVYYTTDGTTPTTSSSSITVDGNSMNDITNYRFDTDITLKCMAYSSSFDEYGTVKTVTMTPDYFWVQNNSNTQNATINVSAYWRDNRTGNCYGEYSFDKETWTSFTWTGVYSTSDKLLTNLAPNQKVYLRQTNSNCFIYSELPNFYEHTFSIKLEGGENKISVGGNMASINRTTYNGCTANYGNNLFDNSTGLYDASQLRFGLDNYYVGAQTGTNTNRDNVYICGYYAFRGCSNLAYPPELPATTLVNRCYYGMFSSSPLLKIAPILPATTLVTNCYNAMFNSCSRINFIQALFTTTPSSSYTSSWVSGVSATGTFVKNSTATWSVTGNDGVPTGWTETVATPFYIENKTNSQQTVTITCPTLGSIHSFNVQVSANNSSWSNMGTVSVGGSSLTATISANSKLYLRATADTWSGANDSNLYSTTISCTGSHEVGGNILSLLYGSSYTSKQKLTNSSYQFAHLLYNDTTLTSAENLLFMPTITLNEGIFLGMFQNCTSLTATPELPWELEPYCYDSMFRGCTSLTTAPELPSETLVEGCYNNMFDGCTSLNNIKAYFTTTPSNDYTENWVRNVASSGTFVKNGSATWSVTGDNGIPTGWNLDYDYSNEPFYIANLTNSANTLTFYKENSSYSANLTIYVSTDRTTWTQFSSSYSIPAYSKIYLKCNTSQWVGMRYYNNAWNYYYTSIRCSKSFEVGGNIMSLLYGDEFKINVFSATSNRNFYGLFKNSVNLKNADKLVLPAETLKENTYAQMFYGCTALETAPSILPAKTLVSYCYAAMFIGCTSLTTAPALRATTLANYCCFEMFYNCTSLTTAPALPATTLANACYLQMFYGCTSLTTAPALPATTLIDNCYNEMFELCSSLTTAPELPATTLVSYCYNAMFQGCTSLTTAPVLPATTLVNYCYQSMFQNCSSLNYIKAMFTTTPSTSYTSSWVNGVSATGTFVKNSTATWSVTGVNGIPSGWTVQTASA